MIYLSLFLTFLEIGAVAFGGGYAMISLVRDAVVSNGWLTEAEFLNIIAVSESTPGPIAINMATFVGSEQGGFLGAVLATLGVITPSVIIILLIAGLFKNVLNTKVAKSVLAGVRPAVIGLIIGTALIMILSQLFSVSSVATPPVINLRPVIIFLFAATVTLAYKFFTNKYVSPIILILISGALGILLYLF